MADRPTFEEEVDDYTDGREDGRKLSLGVGSRDGSVYVRIGSADDGKLLTGELPADQAERVLKGLQDAIRNVSSR